MRPFSCTGRANGENCAGKTRNMKKAVAFLGRLLALSILAAPLSVWALGFLDDDFYYNFESGSDTRVRVSGPRNTSATHITIPSTVVYEYYDYNDMDDNGHAKLKRRTCTVTGIEGGAFYNCSGLTSVTIGNGVTSIGNSVFAYCSGLTSITIPDSVTSIGSYAFERCSGLTSITIPDSVTSIGSGAFGSCSGLTSVTIPDSVTSIGDDAFYNCSGIKSVTVPQYVLDRRINSVFGYSYQSITNVAYSGIITNISERAFQVCQSLLRVTIPNTVKGIGDYAFTGCSGLTSVTIGDNVTSIGSSAFSGCSGLTSIVIPDSVTSISSSAFSGCSGLTSVTIGNGVTSIGSSAFSGCSELTSVTIPDGVTSIGNYAFDGCSGLTSVTIPDSVTSIGDWAFYNCSGLTSVTIGNGVTSIGSSAFEGCSGLSTVWIGSSATDIHNTAFNLCENLQRFIVDAENPAYASPDGALCSKDLKTLVIYPRGRTDARLPDSLVAAMPDAFAGCNKLWMEWCKRINTIPYDLTQTPGDRAIADVTVNGDMALDAFVLKEGKVYDSVLYVHNNADHAVKVTLPSIPLTEYKTFKGATPLTLPAYSTSILTITRVAGGNAGGNVFLVTREELETVK